MKSRIAIIGCIAGVLLLSGVAIRFGITLGQTEETEPKLSVNDIMDERHGNIEESSEDNGFELSTMAEPTAGSEEVCPPDDAATGLRAYFQHKVVVNKEKVYYYLHVREKADANSDIIGVMYLTDVVPYTQKKGNWYEVQISKGTGYVHADYVLSNDDAYRAFKDSVGYAVMAKENEIILYEKPDDSDPGIQLAWKGDAYRVCGVTDWFYKVSVVSPIYEYLYVRKADVLLYYLFLGSGNRSGLSEEEERALGELNISENVARTALLQQEAEENNAAKAAQEAAWEAYMRSSEEAEKKATAPKTQWTPDPVKTQTTASNGLRYLGAFAITHYCHCQICCHAWGVNDPNYQAYGASGMPLQSLYSVAVDPAVINYGTRLLINGKEYVAADTGVSGNTIDVYCKTHDLALSMGMYYADVYVIE